MSNVTKIGQVSSEDDAMRRSTIVVMPAHNEAGAIDSTVAGVRAAGWEVVVVDDGSGDETAAAARQAGATVVAHSVNLGQGAALRTGFAWALRHPHIRFVVTFDADGQHPPEAIAKLVHPLATGEVDVTLGSRFLESTSQDGVPKTRRWLLHFATRVARWTTGLYLTDTHNGLRGFRVDALRCVDLHQDRMAHASEILSEIARCHLRMREVAVKVAYTDYSRAKGQRSIDAISILWDLTISRGK
jgi:glycosyltransferase involved in cell wall biosynthesis